MDGLLGPIIGGLGSLCDCVFWIAVIGGGIWFFVLRKTDDGSDPIDAAANAANKALDDASNAFATDDEEDDVATVVAPQPKPVSEAASKPARPPRSAGATIIAFDDDDLLDD